MTSTFRQVGSTLGSAALGSWLFSALAASLMVKAEASIPEEQRASKSSTRRCQAIIALWRNPQLGTAADDAKTAYTDAARVMTLAAAGCIVVGLGFSFGLPSDRRGREDEE